MVKDKIELDSTPSPKKEDFKTDIPPKDGFKKIMEIGKSDESRKKTKKRYQEGEIEETKESVKPFYYRTTQPKQTNKVGQKIKVEGRTEANRLTGASSNTSNVEITSSSDTKAIERTTKKRLTKTANPEKKTPTPSPSPNLIKTRAIKRKEIKKSTTLKPKQDRSTKTEKAPTNIAVAGIPKIEPTKPTISLSKTTSVKLPSEVYKLYQRIMGVLLIEHNKGITDIKFDIRLPDSIFDQCTVSLKHYDTAKQFFNLELQGSVEAVAIFSKYAKTLEANLNKNLPFKINVTTPTLKKPKRLPKKQDFTEEENGQYQ